jgi:hypothetical protein
VCIARAKATIPSAALHPHAMGMPILVTPKALLLLPYAIWLLEIVLGAPILILYGYRDLICKKM